MQTRCHLSVLIHEQAKKYGDKPALTFRNFGSQKWKDVSWNQFSLRVKQVSNALLNLGLKPQDKIAVFSQNCIQYLYTDFGAYGVRVISIPFYATSSEQQIQYMLNDSEIRILFVGEQEQYDKAHRVFALCPTLERIVIYDPSVRISSHDPNTLYFEDFIKLGENLPRQSEVEKLWSEASDKDICNILYTSGTTGDSKGVVLTYGQYKAAVEANAKCVPVNENDRVINFLPFTHIFERGWAYLAMTKGALMIINTYPKEIQDSMRETHPTCMSSVPRFWEKVYIAVKAKMDSASAIQKKIFQAALAVGHKRNIVYKSKGHRVPLLLELQYKAYNKSILGLVRKQLGLDHPHIFPTAGAYVSPEVEEFIHSIGINMIVGYGLTESLATVSCDHANEPFTIGSVGRPIDGIQIKIGENDEILLKGPTITPGYYHRDSVNAKSFDEDGFFHTGDAGYLKNGELFLKERIKDLFKTSNGKYIAPQQIEALLLVDKFVDQVVVIADQRKFVSALIVPDFRVLEEWAREHKIKVDSRESLCSNEKVVKMMFDRIKTLQQQLAPYEQIKQFTLLAHHFSMESGELTNTLKIRRSVIYKNFKEIIDKMYEC
ncbi:AMP-dependent synthetase/ligase [Segatella bryantii]|uniref:Long-chain fatty acid--CoA ligase n=1 Tax=Segatella bryantii TaxID=77095 RepID=A0ABX4EHX5_SEGBR|nr:long-chain fatty acid--CoA ligase [Segatella bryantii]MDR4931967.1 long-chain fatty acid--CoA ligase [Segatella bryantii]OYP55605.1 long-chain fatty acid--CoA ligase [Segatella bryantii]UKK80824.1 long-chain fatty acid--CoA ligase [Segatella bryantii]